MNHILDKLLKRVSERFPDSCGVWIDDLRLESRHVPAGFRRTRFLWGGVKAAFGEILRLTVGPKRLGQALFAVAGFAVCLMLYAAAILQEDPAVKSALFLLIVVYGFAAGLAAFNLKILKRFTLCGSLAFLVSWVGLAAPTLATAELPLAFLRALSLEACGVMIALFIGASYLDWVENPNHA